MKGQVCVPLKVLSCMKVHLAKRSLSNKQCGNMNQTYYRGKEQKKGRLLLTESTSKWPYSLDLGVKISLVLQQARVLKSMYS